MEWWHGGGIGMYAVLGVAVLVGGFAALTFALAVGAWLFRPLRTVGRIAGVLGVLACITPLMAGAAAGVWSRWRVDAALASSPDLDPDQREAIARVGDEEARTPTMFGGGVTCLLLVPASIAAMLALAIPRSAPVDDD